MLLSFCQEVKRAGLPCGMDQVLMLVDGVRKGLAPDLTRFFLLARLVFVKRLEHYALFHETFLRFFLGLEPGEIEALLRGMPLEEWLRGKPLATDVIEREGLPEVTDLESLYEALLSILEEQKGRHMGGATWVGTQGTSCFGHSGMREEGLRIKGESTHLSALAVLMDNRYLDYSRSSSLSMANLSQALQMMRFMLPKGPLEELDVDATIDRAAKNGGEIELVFTRGLRDKIQVVLALDNGGSSMDPYVELVKLVFERMREHFKDLDVFYFHNLVYGDLFRDPQRVDPYPVTELLERDEDTRVIFIGDANMAPVELLLSGGAVDPDTGHKATAHMWLRLIRERFPKSAWLNPIPRETWDSLSPTIREVGSIFPMEDLTLAGIQAMARRLGEG